MSRGKKWLKSTMGWTLALALFFLNYTPAAQSLRNLPDTVSLVSGQRLAYDLLLPLTVSYEGEAVQVLGSQDETLADVGVRQLTIIPNEVGTSNITLSLFGVIPVKNIQVRVVDKKVLIPGGMAIGVTLYTDGVLVVGMSSVLTQGGGQICPARAAGLQAGDSILAVNGQSVKSVDEFVELVKQHGAGGKTVKLDVKRAQAVIQLELTPALDQNGAAKIGVWARDSTAGVGTMTYYDPQSTHFGALGHPITDADTGTLLSVSGGNIYLADVVGCRMGQRGKPGELKGVFGTDSASIGKITGNTLYGIFGEISSIAAQSPYPAGLPVAPRTAVQEGPATILSTVDAGGIAEYDCEIVQLFQQEAISSKSMVIKITDEELIKKTGGIVQGMSGSPILQNGCIVGAVTHVYVSDPTKGYGIYIEWMLDAQT